MFNFKRNVVKQHQINSDNALSMFNKTLDSIDSAQQSIEEDINSAQATIEAAFKEKQELELIQIRNAKISGKIRKFFTE
tara:strand:- start:12617 stop:12853 length:237 start_codon:yes stop_codon:yes gene_type:complete